MNPDSFSLETRQQAILFDEVGERYEIVFGNNPHHADAVKWLLEHLPSNSHILDVGSGTGIPTARMLVDAGHKVTGVDISAKMIEISQRQVPQANFIQADAANLTFAQGSFHAITAFFSLLMLRRSTIETTIQKLASMLQSPGYLVLSMVEGDFDYQEFEFLGQPAHMSAYPRDVITRILKERSFNILDSQVVKFQPNEQAPPETQLFFLCQYQS